ncbi:CysZ-like protein [Roseovarius albus]|uniref:CysZ-like protein n=1 Tax=Roseovarius albus TaxID=1247867 RepID=A0A1X7A2C3_9RHOB|nr:EI24 domain-containing protein [Roseovarius albus]SLN68592.1 CysZ-like protein [Roseovarius albus]
MDVGVIFSAFFKALGQMGDHRFRRVLLIGVGLTIALLIGVYAVFLTAAQWFLGDTTTLPLLGGVTWISDLVSWGSVFLMLGLSVFLMVPVASAITSFFLEDVAKAVEARHYPNLPEVPPVPFWEAMKDTVNFLGVLIGLNIVALFIYMLFPPFALFIFWGLNGFLLGTEYFQITAMRRVGRIKAKQLRRKHLLTIWVAGILMAMPLSIPLVNLIIPILGAATFTHIFHVLVREDAA